jgi:hypothetical protein
MDIFLSIIGQTYKVLKRESVLELFSFGDRGSILGRREYILNLMCKDIERPKIYFKDSHYFCSLYVKPHEMYSNRKINSRNYHRKANHLTIAFVTSILWVTIAT